MNGAENGRLPATGIASTMSGRMLGLTKREAFAMAAMSALLSNPNRVLPLDRYDAPEKIPSQTALVATEFADALLAELAKDAP